MSTAYFKPHEDKRNGPRKKKKKNDKTPAFFQLWNFISILTEESGIRIRKDSDNEHLN